MDMMNIPVILGHEIAGTITEVGKGVEKYKVGDRVAVCPMGAKDGRVPGYATDGGYSTYTTAAEESLIPVPDNVDIRQAAAATDAGGTAYHALVTQGGVKKGTKVGIIGIGGLGTVGMKIAIARGAEVYAATRNANAQEKARKAGCHKVSASIKDFTDDQLDVIIDYAGAGQTTADAIMAIKPGGTVVLVGLGKMETTIPSYPLISKQAYLTGSIGSTTEEIKALIDLISDGTVDIATEDCTLEQVPDQLVRLDEGGVQNRIVMVNKD
jgi:propanol-preferring alcohol dehydrogenase